MIWRGPVEFSTNTDLVSAKSLTCWDVNGYYRDLGVPFPYTHASRGDLRKAYLDSGGPNDARKTFVFKQLLNRATKDRYDSWPLGPMPFWDRYVEEQVKAQAMAEMRRRGLGTEDIEFLASIFARLGVEVIDESATEDDPLDGVDTPNGEVKDRDEASASAHCPFPFSFYLWRTVGQDLVRLAQWQELLIRSFSARRITTVLSLGYVGDTHHRWVVRKVGYRNVVFFSTSVEPDLKITDEVVSSFLDTDLSLIKELVNMVDSDLDFSSREGSEVAREVFKNSGSQFDRVDFFSLDASPGGVSSGKDQAIVRFLSDHARLPDQNLPPWITAEQHSMVPTKARPADFKEGANWPSKMGCVCRNGVIFKKKYGDCYVCTLTKADGKPFTATNRTWAIAVLREEVFGDGTEAMGGPERKGKVVGIRDQAKEVAVTDKDGKPTGEVKIVKRYVKINLGWKNFFGPMSGFAGRYGTVLDRDYHIKREGTGPSDTAYHPVPLDPITLPDGSVYDMRNEALRKEKHPDLPNLYDIVEEQASDAYFYKFFIPGDAPSTGTQQAGPATVPNTPSSEQSQERIAALKDRILPTGSGSVTAVPASGQVAL